jgi:hypothetical protein
MREDRKPQEPVTRRDWATKDNGELAAVRLGCPGKTVIMVKPSWPGGPCASALGMCRAT